MITQESLHYDSLGIVPRKGEPEPQYLNRAREIEIVYRDFRRKIELESDMLGVFSHIMSRGIPGEPIIQVSDSVPIEECGFEKPVMPIIHMNDIAYSYRFPSSSLGISVPFKMEENKRTLYQVPVIRASLKGEEVKEVKEHEELHSIRYLLEDMDVPLIKRRRRDIIFNAFYNRETIRGLPLELYGEMFSYLTSDVPFKEKVKNISIADTKIKDVKLLENLETNTDFLEHFLNKVYVEPPKRNAIMATYISIAASGVDAVLGNIGSPSLFLTGLAALYGARAIGKGCEYYNIRKATKEFVDTAEIMEGLCRDTGYSFLPTVSRLEFKEIRPCLKEIKTKGIDEFFGERIKDPVEGYRWEIMHEKTKATKSLPKLEL